MRDCVLVGVTHLRARRSLALSIVRFTLASTLVALALVGAFYLPDDTGSYTMMVAWSVAAGAVVAMALALHVGLLSSADGQGRARLGFANRLTIIRFVLVAPVTILILHGKWVPALVAYAVCSGTDIVDGIVARRNGEQSDFGTIMDPVADIVSTAAVFAALLAIGLVPPWVFAILMVRYASLFFGALLLFLTVGPLTFKATPVGKIVGVLQAVGAILIIVLAASGLPWQAHMGRIIFPFLGMIFGSVIVSQVVIGVRHIRRSTEHV